MTAKEFTDRVRENAARIHDYALGMDGSDGTSDCIGLIIGALRLAGVAWGGTHGTNYARRYRMRTLHPAAEGVQIGDAVFKSRARGESGYSLPDAYRNGSDLRDYYHVGVVTDTSPLRILHVTRKNGKGGVFEENSLSGWDWAGRLQYVDGGESVTVTLDRSVARALLASLRNVEEEIA